MGQAGDGQGVPQLIGHGIKEGAVVGHHQREGNHVAIGAVLGIFLVKIKGIGGIRHQVVALEFPLVNHVHAAHTGGAFGHAAMDQVVDVDVAPAVEGVLFRLIGIQHSLLLRCINARINGFVFAHIGPFLSSSWQLYCRVRVSLQQGLKIELRADN